ncbi:hypothetical protein EYF80_039492 [Liparis tanakae]|uniref:Uncharacterized protein n=1 Tax=Liparis tanakae TaxID=230148 RepID=A0A4Z2GBL5_9TELE|nr:hypothetical protein EYF80_039492 [Liparis tanakae]
MSAPWTPLSSRLPLYSLIPMDRTQWITCSLVHTNTSNVKESGSGSSCAVVAILALHHREAKVTGAAQIHNNNNNNNRKHIRNKSSAMCMFLAAAQFSACICKLCLEVGHAAVETGRVLTALGQLLIGPIQQLLKLGHPAAIISLVVFKQRLQGFEDLNLTGDSRWWGCLSLHHCHPQTAFVTRHQTLQLLVYTTNPILMWKNKTCFRKRDKEKEKQEEKGGRTQHSASQPALTAARTRDSRNRVSSVTSSLLALSKAPVSAMSLCAHHSVGDGLPISIYPPPCPAQALGQPRAPGGDPVYVARGTLSLPDSTLPAARTRAAIDLHANALPSAVLPKPLDGHYHIPPPTRPALAIALPAAHPPARPSRLSNLIRQQILAGNYIDLAQLIHPSASNPQTPRELLTPFDPVELSQPLPTRSKELTTTEFAYAFSLYRHVIYTAVIYTAVTVHRPELDNYITVILNLALRFGNNRFYTYHVLFASEATGRVQQFNQGTWKSMQPQYQMFQDYHWTAHCEDICPIQYHNCTSISSVHPTQQPDPPHLRQRGVDLPLKHVPLVQRPLQLCLRMNEGLL